MKYQILDQELYDGAPLGPRYQHDAGIDLRIRETVTVHAGQVSKVPLGIAFALPPGTVGWLTGRSSAHVERGLFCHEGKIDPGYRGEVHAFLTSTGSPVLVERGERICQLLVVQIMQAHHWQEVTQLEDTERGERGFGSSGRD